MIIVQYCLVSRIALLMLIIHGMFIQSINAVNGIKAVSVFRNDEIVYHKYSAILAASEPFRLQLENEIKSALNPFAYFLRKIKGPAAKPLSDLRFESSDIDLACERYEKRVDDIVKSYGLSTTLFNDLSKKIALDSDLKQRVLLQAYYYRIAADLENNIRDELPILPSVTVSGRILKFSPIKTEFNQDPTKINESQLTRFCKTLRAIEYERLKLRQHLQNSLGLKSLPERMCDPDIYPAMTKEIQQACVDFSAIANAVVDKYQFTQEDFKELQKKMKQHGLFRYRVERELRRLEDKAKSSNKEYNAGDEDDGY